VIWGLKKKYILYLDAWLGGNLFLFLSWLKDKLLLPDVSDLPNLLDVGDDPDVWNVHVSTDDLDVADESVFPDDPNVAYIEEVPKVWDDSDVLVDTNVPEVAFAPNDSDETNPCFPMCLRATCSLA